MPDPETTRRQKITYEEILESFEEDEQRGERLPWGEEEIDTPAEFTPDENS